MKCYSAGSVADKLVEYEGKTEKQRSPEMTIKLPDGWLWKEGQRWTVDMNRAVDEQGMCMYYNV